MSKYKNIIVFVFTFLIIGCGAHTNLTPIGEGNIDANISLGGPVITINKIRTPAPYLTIGGKYGLSDVMNVDANLHVTSLFYKVAGLEFGAAWFPLSYKNSFFILALNPRILLLESLKENVGDRLRIYPLLSGSAAWTLGGGLIYVGSDLVFPLTQPDYNKNSPRLIASIFTGYRWQISDTFGFVSELKWLGANIPSNQVAVEYINIAKYGAVSLLFSIEKRF